MRPSAVLLVALFATSQAPAQKDQRKGAPDAPRFPGQPSMGLALPAGWHRGSELDLEISGKGLFAPRDLLFYKPGIELVSIREVEDREMDSYEKDRFRRDRITKLRRKFKGEELEQKIAEPFDYPRKGVSPGTHVTAKLRIDAEAEPGEYPFRLLTDGGLGALTTFWVGKFPTVAESEPRKIGGSNDRAEDAQAVEPGQTVNGFIARYDKDVFKVSAEKGQRLTFEIEAARLATYERGDYLDTQLAVHDSGGKQLAAVDDTALFIEDPYLSFVAPADGDYFVTVEESVPSGSSNLLPYRLHVTSGARPAMLYPAGGRPGQKIAARWISDSGEGHEAEVELPSGDTGAEVSVYASADSPSGNPARLFDGDNVLEGEGEETAASAAPVALNGILSEPGDRDTFRVPLKKGVRYTVRCFSSSLGSSLDLDLEIAASDKRGRKARANDSGEEELDRTMVDSHRDRLDPATVFTPEEDGDYLFTVTDSRGGGSPAGVYRIEIAEARDAVLAHVVPPRNNEPRRGNRIQIAPGSRYSAVVSLRDAFGSEAEGEFELVASGLPKGVTLKAPTFTSANTRLPVVFECAKNAKPGAALIDLRARPAGGGKPLPGGFRGTVPFNAAGGNAYLHYAYLDQLALAVTREPAFRLLVDAPDAALTQDGEIAIGVRIERSKGFDQPVEINTEWLPPNAGRPSPVTLEPGDDRAEFIIGARRNTPPEEYRIAFVGSTRAGDRRTGDGMSFAASGLVPLRVAEPYLSVKLPRAAVEVGKTAEFTAQLEHINPFEGSATATLGRLPNGVEMVGEPVAITPGQKEITFTVRATEAALTGSYRGMFCALEFTENGQTVSQRSGYGTLRIDAKRGKKVASRN